MYVCKHTDTEPENLTNRYMYVCNSQRSVASPACDPLALERLDKFLEHRLKGIQHISDIVHKDDNDAQLILQHLGAPV